MTECNTPNILRTYFPAGSQNIGAPQNMTLYQQQLQKHNFDQFIANELKRLRSTLTEEESRYIKIKLTGNPVELERRTRSPHSSAGEENTGHPETKERGITSPERVLLREQRAASCRKSRINNKLKKASLQYRNEFMAGQVSQAKLSLAEIGRKIKNAEQRLLASGHSQVELAQWRDIYGFGGHDATV